MRARHQRRTLAYEMQQYRHRQAEPARRQHAASGMQLKAWRGSAVQMSVLAVPPDLVETGRMSPLWGSPNRSPKIAGALSVRGNTPVDSLLRASDRLACSAR